MQQVFFRSQTTEEGQHCGTQKSKAKATLTYITTDCWVLKLGADKPIALPLQPFEFHRNLCSPSQAQAVTRGMQESLKGSRVEQGPVQQTLAGPQSRLLHESKI